MRDRHRAAVLAHCPHEAPRNARRASPDVAARDTAIKVATVQIE
jgi:hypothetical protein